MDTETLKIALFVLVDLLFIAYFLYVVYKLNKRVIELETKLNKKDVVFRISGNDLIGVLERKQNTENKTK